ncbi:MAG: AAA family ATPase, partial [Clostridia bacterium]|nr:AAA family ATPase [Clostridia bacterium]
MKLLHCEISNFGCLSGVSLSFQDGFNLIYAPNGSGKSTLAVFLKAMLYGLPATGRRDITENERKRYKPWNGGPYGGSLELEAAGKLYRIERFFGAKEKDDTLAIYDLATGKTTLSLGEVPGLTLFGVDADGFERSLYLSQRFPFIGPDNNTIRARLGSLLDSSEDLGSFEMADGLLDDVRRYYMVNGGRGRIKDLSDLAMAKEEEGERSRQAAEQAARLGEEERALSAEKEALQATTEELRKKRRIAERRQLLEEQTATFTRLNESVEAEKRALKPLEDFFASHLPSELEIKATDFLLSEKTGAEARLAACRLTDEEEAKRAAAEERIGDAATAENIFRLKETDKAWQMAKEKAKIAYPFDINEFNALDSRFAGEVPSEETISRVYAADQAFSEANANLFVAESEKKKGPSAPLMAFGALTVVALAMSILGFALSQIAVGIVSIGLTAVFTALFVLFLRRRPKGKDTLAEIAAAKKEILTALLLPYGYTDKDPSESAALFFTHIARYRS